MERDVGPSGAVVTGDEAPPGIVGGGEGLVSDFVVESAELRLHVYDCAVACGATVGGFHMLVVAFVVY